LAQILRMAPDSTPTAVTNCFVILAILYFMDENAQQGFIAQLQTLAVANKATQLELDVARLDAAGRAHVAVLCTLSHDLKGTSVNAIQELDNIRDALAHVNDQDISYVITDGLDRASAECVHLQRSVRCLQMKADIAGGTYVDNAYVRPIHIRGLLEPLCSRYHHLKLKIPEELQQIHCDADALYHVLHNAVRNGVRHGKTDAMIVLEVAVGDNGTTIFTVINCAGPKHARALELQVIYGNNFLLKDVADTIDLASTRLGADDSSFQGCFDIRKFASAMGGSPTLSFEPNAARFTLRLPRAVKAVFTSPAPTLVDRNTSLQSQADLAGTLATCIQLTAQSTGGPMQPGADLKSVDDNGLPMHFLYVDDQNAVRVQALKLSKAIGVHVEDAVISREELKRNFYRHEKHMRIWGRAASELTTERFLAVVQEWEGVPAMVILDQNIDFGHTLLLGTDICKIMRKAGFEGVILIRSGNDSAHDTDLYLSCKADGVLQKTVKFAELVTEVKEWSIVATAKARCASENAARGNA